MISPEVAAQLAPDDRVSVTSDCLNQVMGLLSELPVRQAMGVVLRIQQEAEVCGHEQEGVAGDGAR